jgi:thioredoxin reductase/ferredoxin
MLFAGLACAAGIALAAGFGGARTLRASPGPLSRPHVHAKLACAACHGREGEGVSAAAACTGCHAPSAHGSTRPGHASLRKQGKLTCTDCHRAHGEGQTVAIETSGAFVRSGGGAETEGQLPHGAPSATVPLVPLSACARCHDLTSRTDPIAPCAAGLGARATSQAASLCFDEHQTPKDASGITARSAARFAAWTAAAEVARSTAWVAAPRRGERGGVTWLGAGVAASALVVAIRRRLRRRARADADKAHVPVAPAAVRKLPVIDASTCLGCHACVDACPFDVFEVQRFVAVVARPDDCCGVVLCEQACPNGSLRIAEGDLEPGRPVVDEHLESVEVPGLLLAGDLTGLPLIKNALRQGKAAADRVGATLPRRARGRADADVIIVGAGPAGLAASLRAKELGLRYVTLEQATVAASIQAFPRHKLVYDQPLEVPCEGELWLRECTKEELLAQWTRVVRKHALAIRERQRVVAMTKSDELFAVEVEGEAGTQTLHAPRVIVAIGRRGSPKKLPIEVAPGCESKVFYHLADARALADQRVIIVGLGDTAMEAAIALANQPGTHVTICHRGEDFRRGKARNISELKALVRRGKVELRFATELVAVDGDGATVREGSHTERLPADAVFVLVGGLPSWKLLEGAGVGHARLAAQIVSAPDA